ncbi:hypothetical protein NS220_02680 [Microbacterium testaceum]|uniref:Uncharacterized protein n=1 Tax=Microbacterium testaceum TaxID=2033 RepID=A0A147F0D5_MICTE|nr:hypothetical protein [Microbacterium testaceum]KTR96343.1 hypothetical protein NS220_02680 [Microbacterium testaceum]
MIYVLVGGPRDGQHVDDLPRGYRLSLSDPPPERFGEFETVRAVWFELDQAVFRPARSRD